MMQSQHAPCPKCGGTASQKMGYTWWGGMLGPTLLSHVRCPGCKTQYNGKTGKSNTAGIALYFAVLVILAIIIGVISSLGRR